MSGENETQGIEMSLQEISSRLDYLKTMVDEANDVSCPIANESELEEYLDTAVEIVGLARDLEIALYGNLRTLRTQELLRE